MGLAAPRKRRKIAADPNNTAWARNTSSYGQRILANQGWTPGSVLGAIDAPQASHYTAATASHIRVVLKDDNLGLGARPGHSKADNFGLNVLQDIYGRLNGKSTTDLQKEQAVRSDLNRRAYVEQKYGTMGFISGGFLVGDRIEEEIPVETKSSKANAPEKEMPVDGEAPRIEESTTAVQETKEDRRQRKLAKRQRKLEKQQRKEARALRKQQRAQEAEVVSSSSSAAEETAATTTTTTPQQSLPASPPPSSGSEQQQNAAALRGRMAVRKRYIQQKKMAGMNPQALREILMLKS